MASKNPKNVLTFKNATLKNTQISFESKKHKRQKQKKQNNSLLLFSSNSSLTSNEIISFLNKESEQSFLIDKANTIRSTFRRYLFRKRLKKFIRILIKTYRRSVRLAFDNWYLATAPPASTALAPYNFICTFLSDSSIISRSDHNSYFEYVSSYPNIHFCSYSEYMKTNMIFLRTHLPSHNIISLISTLSQPLLSKAFKNWSKFSIAHMILFSRKPEIKNFSYYRSNFGPLFNYYFFWKNFVLYHKQKRFDLINKSIYVPEFSWYRGRKLTEISKKNQADKQYRRNICHKIISYLHKSSQISENCRNGYKKLIPILNKSTMLLIKQAFTNLVISRKLKQCIQRRVLLYWYQYIDSLLIIEDTLNLFKKRLILKILERAFKVWRIFVKGQQQMEAYTFYRINSNRGKLIQYAFLFNHDYIHFIFAYSMHLWMKTVLQRRKTKNFIKWCLNDSRNDALKKYFFDVFKAKAKIRINFSDYCPFREELNPKKQQVNDNLKKKFNKLKNNLEKIQRISKLNTSYKIYTSSVKCTLIAVKNTDYFNDFDLKFKPDQNLKSNIQVPLEINSKELMDKFREKHNEDLRKIPQWKQPDTITLLYHLFILISQKKLIQTIPLIPKLSFSTFVLKNVLNEEKSNLFAILQSQDDEASQLRVKTTAILLRDHQILSSFIAHRAAIDFSNTLKESKQDLHKHIPNSQKPKKQKEFSLDSDIHSSNLTEYLPTPLHIPRRAFESSPSDSIHPLLLPFDSVKKNIIADQRRHQRQSSDIFSPKPIKKVFSSPREFTLNKNINTQYPQCHVYEKYERIVASPSIQRSIRGKNFTLQEIQAVQNEVNRMERLKAVQGLKDVKSIRASIKHRETIFTQKRKIQLENQEPDSSLVAEIRTLSSDKDFSRLKLEKKVEILLSRYFDILLFIFGYFKTDLNISQKISYAMKLCGDDAPQPPYKFPELPNNIGCLMNQSKGKISQVISELTSDITHFNFTPCEDPNAGAVFTTIVIASRRTKKLVEKKLGPLKGIDRFESMSKLKERLEKGITIKNVIQIPSEMNKTIPSDKKATNRINSPSFKGKKNVCSPKISKRDENVFDMKNSPSSQSSVDEKEVFDFQTQAPIQVPQAKYLTPGDEAFFISLTPYIIPPVLLLNLI